MSSKFIVKVLEIAENGDTTERSFEAENFSMNAPHPSTGFDRVNISFDRKKSGLSPCPIEHTLPPDLCNVEVQVAMKWPEKEEQVIKFNPDPHTFNLVQQRLPAPGVSDPLAAIAQSRRWAYSMAFTVTGKEDRS